MSPTCLKRKIERKKKTDEHRRGKTKPKKETGDRSETKKSLGKIKKQKNEIKKALRGKIYNIKKLR
jgi:hypothetical protein